MDFSFSEEQEAVRELADRIFTDLSTQERLREMETDSGSDRFDAKLWSELAAAGLLGIALPEEVGGAGRGFLGGWPFPGPWLQPGFAEKLFSDLPRNIALMHDIIDRFNAMLARIVADPVFAHVHYIDLRGTLSADLTSNIYQSWWANELHPTEQGFAGNHQYHR